MSAIWTALERRQVSRENSECKTGSQLCHCCDFEVARERIDAGSQEMLSISWIQGTFLSKYSNCSNAWSNERTNSDSPNSASWFHSTIASINSPTRSLVANRNLSGPR